jgi:hypothetical protein
MKLLPFPFLELQHIVLPPPLIFFWYALNFNV